MLMLPSQRPEHCAADPCCSLGVPTGGWAEGKCWCRLVRRTIREAFRTPGRVANVMEVLPSLLSMIISLLLAAAVVTDIGSQGESVQRFLHNVMAAPAATSTVARATASSMSGQPVQTFADRQKAHLAAFAAKQALKSAELVGSMNSSKPAGKINWVKEGGIFVASIFSMAAVYAWQVGVCMTVCLTATI